MGEEAKDRERDRLLYGIERLSRDFLRRFNGNGSTGDLPEGSGVASHDVELNLSLGGCFGAGSAGRNDSTDTTLVRSSSIASFSSLPGPAEHEFPVVAPTLMRTSSLPAESDEDRRKRKEMQALRRLEAKRKRLEKMNSTKAATSRAGAKSDDAVDNGKGSTVPVVQPAWAAGSKAAAPRIARGSTGSSSTGVLGFRSCAAQGSSNGGSGNHAGKAARSPAKEEDEEDEEDPAKVSAMDNGTEEPERKIMEQMPCVSTRGDGPNGRRIEGFLYKYKKGEEVRIVCVCHGSFLTPAEFVKHAGGGDVAHPLRHIVVSPAPFTCL